MSDVTDTLLVAVAELSQLHRELPAVLDPANAHTAVILGAVTDVSGALFTAATTQAGEDVRLREVCGQQRRALASTLDLLIDTAAAAPAARGAVVDAFTFLCGLLDMAAVG